ncbi:phage tail protein [Rickettsiales bacterium LUAb2]
MTNNTKTFADNEPTLELLDKFLVLTRGQGEDFKASFATLLDILSTNLLKPFLVSQIGNIKPNINNTYRDQTKFSDNYFEYLMLNGQTINKTDYPELFTVLGITDSTYVLPNFANEDGGCTLRHATDGRSLGSYEADSFKNHSHDNSHAGHTIPNHTHNVSIWGRLNNSIMAFGSGASSEGVLSYYEVDGDGGLDSGKWNFRKGGITINVNQNTGGWSGNTGAYNGNTGSAGNSETLMKNIAVQFYIIAKVNI